MPTHAHHQEIISYPTISHELDVEHQQVLKYDSACFELSWAYLRETYWLKTKTTLTTERTLHNAAF